MQTVVYTDVVPNLKMRRLFTILSLITSVAHGQVDTIETDRECEQYNIIIKFIKTDSSSIDYHDVKKTRLNISTDVYKSGLFTFTNLDLITFDTGIPKDSLLTMDRDSLQTIWKKYEKQNKNDTMEYSSNCLTDLPKDKRANISLWFARYNKDILIAHTRKIYRKPRHSKGFIYIFKFEKDNHFMVRQIDYIE